MVTHLGHLLHPGDRALGYDTGNANLVGMDLEQALDKGLQVPDVILVRSPHLTPPSRPFLISADNPPPHARVSSAPTFSNRLTTFANRLSV